MAITKNDIIAYKVDMTKYEVKKLSRVEFKMRIQAQ